MSTTGIVLLNNTNCTIQIVKNGNIVDSMMKPLKKIVKYGDPLRVVVTDANDKMHTIHLSDVCCIFATVRELYKFFSDNACVSTCCDGNNNTTPTTPITLKHKWIHKVVGGTKGNATENVPAGAISFSLNFLQRDPWDTSKRYKLEEKKETTVTDTAGNELPLGMALDNVGSNDDRTSGLTISVLPSPIKIKTNGAAVYISYIIP